MSSHLPLAVIGVGHLAGFLVRGLRRGGFSGEIHLSPRNKEKASKLKETCRCRIAHSNQDAAAAANTILLATRPAVVQEVLSELSFTPEQLVISVAAGVPADELAPFAAPAELVTAMPISAAERCESPTLLYPDNARAKTLLQVLGAVIPVDSAEAFAAASVNSALYGWIFALMGELEAKNTELGLPENVAHKVVTGMFRAASGVAEELPPGGIVPFIAGLATPGGITEEGLIALNEKGALKAWEDTLEKVAGRLMKARS
ncbi:MAG: NAD(P)-binding domain-containing protein [Kiloniellales bacterium]|nr:NAD(P)-binding domain-containing protein [Kiloniellales bacterium]